VLQDGGWAPATRGSQEEAATALLHVKRQAGSAAFFVIYEGRLFLERSENLPASLSREACPLEEGKGWGFSDSTRNPAESFSRPVYLACRQFSNQSIRAGPCPPTLNNPPAPLLREVLRVRTNVDFPTSPSSTLAA
jgi:hypothetical protein